MRVCEAVELIDLVTISKALHDLIFYFPRFWIVISIEVNSRSTTKGIDMIMGARWLLKHSYERNIRHWPRYSTACEAYLTMFMISAAAVASAVRRSHGEEARKIAMHALHSH